VAPDVLPDDVFGSSVALTGTHAIVGASGMDLGDSMADAGAAHVFLY
jgi:hypothetical protein